MVPTASSMPNLPDIATIPAGSRVIIRMDMDVPMKDGHVVDDARLKKSLPTMKQLLEKQCVLLLLGHLGRPKGIDPHLSLRPVFERIVSLIKTTTSETVRDIFINIIDDEPAIDSALGNNNVIGLENLRFYKGEEDNNPAFLHSLIGKAAWYVNDALAVAHRKHRSIMLYKEMQAAYGIAFIEEVRKLMRVVDHPDRPLTVILGGAKKDKLEYVPALAGIADHILIGGKLPQLLPADMPIQEKFCIAALNDTGLDISEHDIAVFTAIIMQSKTIIWAGAMGFFEDPASRVGTEKIAQAMVASNAYTVIAGGDTENSVAQLGKKDKISVIASGGGMMLELLTKKSLPAWE